MASGVPVGDEIIDHFQRLNKRAFSAIVLRVTEAKDAVAVEKTFPPTKGDPEAEWKEIVKTLPENDCRYIICDFQVKETPTVTKSKLALIFWSPETSPIFSKMLYATTLETVSSRTQIGNNVQVNELEELEYSSVKDTIYK